GFQTKARELIERLISLPHDLLSSHWPTMLLSLLTLLVLIGVKRLRPKWPAPLIAMCLAMLLVWSFDLPLYGIRTIGGFS
ncbi:MAG: SulP family inorganic anion transporter, partial [Hafnia sp.]